MLNTLREPESETIRLGFKEQYVSAFKWMLLARTVEDKVAALWHAGKIAGGCYVGRGQEAVSVAVGVMLRPGDLFLPFLQLQPRRLTSPHTSFVLVLTHTG